MAVKSNADHGTLKNAAVPSSAMSSSYVKNVAVKFEDKKNGMLEARMSQSVRISFRLQRSPLQDTLPGSLSRTTKNSTLKCTANVVEQGDSTMGRICLQPVVSTAPVCRGTSDPLVAWPDATSPGLVGMPSHGVSSWSSLHSSTVRTESSNVGRDCAAAATCCVSTLNMAMSTDVAAGTSRGL